MTAPMLSSLTTVTRRSWSIVNPVKVLAGVTHGVVHLRTNFALVRELGMRELRTKYAGQIMGTFWVIGHPLAQLLLLVFVFGVVFKQRIGGTHDLPRDYTTYIMSGLVPWLALVPVFTGACSAVTSQSAIVKQFQIDPQVLPLKDVYLSTIFWFVGICLIILNVLLRERGLPWTYLLLPVVFCVHFAFAIGLAWMLAALCVFMRDLKDFVQVGVQVCIYLLPIVYLPQWVPALFRPLIEGNPLSALIWMYQDALYFGRLEHPFAWVTAILLAMWVFALGQRVFVRLRPHFGKAL